MTIHNHYTFTHQNIILLLDLAENQDQAFWERHSIEVRYNHFVLDEIQPQYSSFFSKLNQPVTNLGRSRSNILSKIDGIVAYSLKNPSLSIREKFSISEKAKALFSKHNQTLSKDNKSIPILLIDDQGLETALTLSIHEISSNDFFKHLICGPYSENEQTDAIKIYLPPSTTAENFINLANFASLTLLEDMLAPIRIAGYLQMSDVLLECVDHACSVLDTDDLYFLITQCSDLSTENHISNLILSYISTFIEENLPIEDMIVQMTTPIFQEKIAHIPLILDLSDVNINDGILNILSLLLPRVRLLNIDTCTVTRIPTPWLNHLEYLYMSETLINKLDRPFTKLKECVAIRCESLVDISGLNNSRTLEILDISQTNIASAPSGCSSLEEFLAESTQIANVDPLNNLKKLRKIDLSYTEITDAPYGCDNLEEFNAEGALQLTNISQLNGLKLLRKVNVGLTNIDSAVRECPNLEEFLAENCRNLQFITGLNESLTIKYLNISGSKVTRAPWGCLNLIEFKAEGASILYHIDGLNDLENLQILDIRRTDVEKAPSGCINLEEFNAEAAKLLRDISDLDSLKKLRKINASRTLVQAAPKKCFALEEFIAESARHFYDLEGLEDFRLDFLTKIVISGTRIDKESLSGTSLYYKIA